MGKRKGEDKIDVPKELKFICDGKLNMIVVRNGKEVSRVNTDSELFLSNPAVVKTATMDTVTFQPNAVFKITLDFKKEQECMPETAVREATTWVLMSCMGSAATFDKTSARLVLQQCVVSIQSNVEALAMPVGLVLRLDDDEWIVERVFR